MFNGIRSLLGSRPQRSETDEKLDEALANAKSLDHYFFFPDQRDAEQAAVGLQERGWTIDSCLGIREMQTFRKLPKRRPRRKAAASSRKNGFT